MRLIVKMGIRKAIEIPSHFRQELLSLIKCALKRSAEDGEAFYKKWYSQNRSKPFTFSAFFPLKRIEGKSILDGDFFKFIFSTVDIEFLSRVYNGLLFLSQNGFNLFGHPAKVISCYLLPERQFSEDEMGFKTLSPFLLRDPKDGDYYLYPKNILKDQCLLPGKFKYWRGVDEEGFCHMLEENLRRAFKEEIKIFELKVNKIIPVICMSKNSSFRATYPGIRAYLKVKAPKEVLKLIYDIGIGARRSEGFGMLEVENE